MGNCSVSDSLSWSNYTDLIQNASTEMLRVRVTTKEPISCLKLSVSEMNNRGPIIVQGIKAVYEPIQTISDSLLEEINAGFLKQPAICPLKDSGLSLPCAARLPDQRFSYHSSLTTCHCDPYCSRFGDCCDDYDDPGLTPPDTAADIIECVSTQFPHITFRQVGFYLITSCLPKYRSTDLEAHCRYPSAYYEKNAVYYWALTVGPRSYKNAFCALCNDEMIRGEHYWQMELLGANSEDCLEALEKVKGNSTIQDLVELTKNTICLHRRELRLEGVAHPVSGLLAGPTRLGKMCLHAAISQDFNMGSIPAPKSPSLVMLQSNRLEVMEAGCFCHECNVQALSKYMFTDMAKIARFITGFKNRYLLTYRNVKSMFIWMLVDQQWKQSTDLVQDWENIKNNGEKGSPSKAQKKQLNHLKWIFFWGFCWAMARLAS